MNFETSIAPLTPDRSASSFLDAKYSWLLALLFLAPVYWINPFVPQVQNQDSFFQYSTATAFLADVRNVATAGISTVGPVVPSMLALARLVYDPGRDIHAAEFLSGLVRDHPLGGHLDRKPVALAQDDPRLALARRAFARVADADRMGKLRLPLAERRIGHSAVRAGAVAVGAVPPAFRADEG